MLMLKGALLNLQLAQVVEKAQHRCNLCSWPWGHAFSCNSRHRGEKKAA
jgi:hypothetical protein